MFITLTVVDALNLSIAGILALYSGLRPPYTSILFFNDLVLTLFGAGSPESFNHVLSQLHNLLVFLILKQYSLAFFKFDLFRFPIGVAKLVRFLLLLVANLRREQLLESVIWQAAVHHRLLT